MKLALPLLAAAASVLASSPAWACPYASSASECAACGTSWSGYVGALLLGLGVGFASVAFERRGRQ